jgi:hypothetical protein
MSNTISFTAKPSAAYYTVDEINALFASIAVVLNGKVDAEAPALVDNLNIGGAAVLNLGEAVDDTDALTLGQLQAMAPEEA